MHVKWLSTTIRDIHEFSMSMISSIADGSLEDAIRELSSILEILGFEPLQESRGNS